MRRFYHAGHFRHGAWHTRTHCTHWHACQGVAWAAKRLVDKAAGRFEAEVTVPADCADQRLVLGVGNGAQDVGVDDVRID